MPTVPIKAIIDTFVKFYQIYFDRESIEDAIQRINRGDCGTAAYGIGLVAEKNGYTVTYYDNDNHAFLDVDGVILDTANPNGTTIEHLNNIYSSDQASKVDAEEIFDSYLEIDASGCSFLQIFFSHYGIEIPEQVLEVVQNIEQYDDPTWVNAQAIRLTTYLGKNNEQ